MGKWKQKLNDKGAALISVLVITTFITILATTMLYIAAMNFQQKQTDYDNKQSFYGAEKALDELKSLMVKDVQTAYTAAYTKTVRNFASMTASQRQSYYQEEFMKALKEIWKKREEASGNDLLQAVKDLMLTTDGDYAGEADRFYKVRECGVFESSANPGDPADTSVLQKFALRGVQVKYTYPETSTQGGYTTFLYTDICIEPPVVDWAAESSTAGATLAEREVIAFTDYVSYVNWRKADYDETYDIDL